VNPGAAGAEKMHLATGDQPMDQEAIAAILVIVGFILGPAVLLATIYFGPNMKKYWDNGTDPE
jgi:VIT1/CCC1 family predicted Fe2+/Mn2+ transporter